MRLALDTMGIVARSWYGRAQGERDPKGLWNTLVSPPGSRHHVRGWLLSSALLWMIALLYLLVTPATYISKLTLILPGSVSGSTVKLDTIGQSSTQPSSPFGSASISPKVIYKEIAESEQVRAQAAKLLQFTLNSSSFLGSGAMADEPQRSSKPSRQNTKIVNFVHSHFCVQLRGKLPKGFRVA